MTPLLKHTKNYCDTLFRNFELKLWQEPDQEHYKKEKNSDFLYINTKSIELNMYTYSPVLQCLEIGFTLDLFDKYQFINEVIHQ